jgi:hypothetical protein
MPTLSANLISERDFKNGLVLFARNCGWLVHHDLPSQRANGSWATATQGDSGYPDLVLAHPGNPNTNYPARIIYAELKTERGIVTAAQQTWLDTLNAAGQVAYIWRPSMQAKINRVLCEPLNKR